MTFVSIAIQCKTDLCYTPSFIYIALHIRRVFKFIKSHCDEQFLHKSPAVKLLIAWWLWRIQKKNRPFTTYKISVRWKIGHKSEDTLSFNSGLSYFRRSTFLVNLLLTALPNSIHLTWISLYCYFFCCWDFFFFCCLMFTT